MKRRSIKLAILSALFLLGLIVIGYQNNILWANTLSSDCPNGCKPNGTGCWCKFWYEYYQEAKPTQSLK